MFNVGIYTRIGQPHAAGAQASLAAQRQLCRREAQRRGWPVVRLYTDTSSANQRHRPALLRLRADIASGTINAVLVQRMSYLAQGQDPLLAFVDFACAHNVALISVGTSPLTYREVSSPVEARPTRRIAA